MDFVRSDFLQNPYFRSVYVWPILLFVDYVLTSILYFLWLKCFISLYWPLSTSFIINHIILRLKCKIEEFKEHFLLTWQNLIVSMHNWDNPGKSIIVWVSSVSLMNWLNVFPQNSFFWTTVITNWALVWFLSFMNWLDVSS